MLKKTINEDEGKCMITLQPITDQASPYWDSLVSIYQQSFPTNEQRPIDDIACLLSNDTRYTLYAIVEDSGALLGLLTTWTFCEFTYIEHFALSPNLRSRGYGTQALSTFIQRTHRPIILEVEPPTDAITQRRIRFYERHGLTLYDYPYMQPPYTPDSQSVELCLMGTIDNHITPLSVVTRTLHHEVYRCDSATLG